MNSGPEIESRWERLKRTVFGRPHDLQDRSIVHRMALIPLLAWIGLGADGLSSSAYGPEECMKAVGQHRYLAIPLGLLTAVTVFVISACYSRLIAAFPQGGGGYVVTSALLGKYPGLVAGCALLIDYVLTISVSVAAAMAALFSFLPPEWAGWKLPFAIVGIVGLVILNIRGVKESVLILTPIFLVFVLTHVVVIGWGIIAHLPHVPETARECATGFQNGLNTLGIFGLTALFFHAYSMGGGTYTGIEAVSNGLGILREPRAANGQRTTWYMAVSLAITAAGLLLCYLLWDIMPVEGRTMNAVLVSAISQGWPGGTAFVWVTLLSEAALLVVAAQAGFIAGPRVLANLALDSWAPHRFSALSERLNAQNGIVLTGAAAIGTLLYTGGHLEALIIMYSINVFITFTLAIFGLLRSALARKPAARNQRDIAVFSVGFALCLTILAVTVTDKFASGGWVTLLITACLVGLCIWIRSHYLKIQKQLEQLRELADRTMPMGEGVPTLTIDKNQPTAALLVGGYNGTGIHTMANIIRTFPGHYKSFVFLSVGVVDSGEFKGEFRVEDLKRRTEDALQRYLLLANSYGFPAAYYFDVDTDVVDGASLLCARVAKDFPRVTFFTGNVIFQRNSWLEQILHNQTASAIQRRLHWDGHVMVVMPMRLR